MSRTHIPSGIKRPQRGLALVFVLLMMAIAITAALFAARSTLLGDKASRNDRDHQIAFQSAELALGDAERDIMDATLALTVSTARGCKFGNPAAGLVADPGCSSNGERRGLCGVNAASQASPSTPIYEQINWEETSDASRVYMNYGEKTGRSAELTTGSGAPPQPAKPPKYIIVQSPVKPQLALPGGKVFQVQAAYKVYALGYGVDVNTKVVLEAQIFKPILEQKCLAAGS